MPLNQLEAIKKFNKELDDTQYIKWCEKNIPALTTVNYKITEAMENFVCPIGCELPRVPILLCNNKVYELDDIYDQDAGLLFTKDPETREDITIEDLSIPPLCVRNAIAAEITRINLKALTEAILMQFIELATLAQNKDIDRFLTQLTTISTYLEKLPKQFDFKKLITQAIKLGISKIKHIDNDAWAMIDGGFSILSEAKSQDEKHLRVYKAIECFYSTYAPAHRSLYRNDFEVADEKRKEYREQFSVKLGLINKNYQASSQVVEKRTIDTEKKGFSLVNLLFNNINNNNNNHKEKPPVLKAISLQDHQVCNHYMKLLIAGGEGTGKTSFILRVTENNFSYSVPNGYSDNQMKTFKLDNKNIKILFAENTPSRYDNGQHYRLSDGAVITIDLTDKESLKMAQGWLNEVERYMKVDTSVVFIGTKCDDKNYCAEFAKEAKHFAEVCGMPYFETSAKTGENVNEALATLVQDVIKKREAKPAILTPIPTMLKNRGNI